MPPCEPVCQVSESGHDDDNLEKLSMETTVLNMDYIIHIIGKGQPCPTSSAINLAILSICTSGKKMVHSIAIPAM